MPRSSASRRPIASRSSRVAVVDHDLAAVAARRRHLRGRRVVRHHDRGRHAEQACRQRDRLRVVAGRERDHAGLALARVEARQRVEGAAELERAHALQVLALEEDLGAELGVGGARASAPACDGHGRRGARRHRRRRRRSAGSASGRVLSAEASARSRRSEDSAFSTMRRDVRLGCSDHDATSKDRPPMPVTTTGFIGIGNMGLGMALRLRDLGFAVGVRDIDPAREALAAAHGAAVHASPAALARRCDVVVVAVVDAAQCEAVLFGADGAAAALAAGCVRDAVSDLGAGEHRRLCGPAGCRRARLHRRADVRRSGARARRQHEPDGRVPGPGLRTPSSS